MLRLPPWHRFPKKYVIVFSAVLVLLFVVEHINGRFWLNDFRVYYGAAEALLHGAPLYGVVHGLDTGIYKYAPLLALVHVPFALLPYGIAASLQYALIALAFLDVSVRLDRMVRAQFFNGRAPSYAALFLTGAVVVVHLHRELHLGNINMLMLWVLVVALERSLQQRDLLSGVLIGAAMLAKPHFVVLLPLLLLRGKFRVGLASVGTVLVGVLLPVVFFGMQGSIALHREWLGQMAQHNAALIHSGGDGYTAVNTAYSFLHRAVLKHWMAPTATEAYAMLGVIALVFGAFVVLNRRREIRAGSGNAFAFEFLLLLALVPSITLTDTEHFLFAMPLVAFLMHHLVPKACPHWLPWIAVPILFAFGGNWEDALDPLADVMKHYGVLGIGNLALMVLCVALHHRTCPRPATRQIADPT